MSKRKLKFYSHISNVKHFKKQSVEELVASCYIKEIIELIEGKALMNCNSCNCSFEQKMECYFTAVLVDLESDLESGVLEKFEEVVKDSNDGYYLPEEVLNAKKMLECGVHRKLMVIENRRYFEDSIESFKYFDRDDD